MKSKNPVKDTYIDNQLNKLLSLQGGLEHTCAEIGEYCGISKQAVHQIQNRALRKLANNHWDLRDELKAPISKNQDVTIYDS
tara:strand:+ start:55 stop:300 length:246 start_codon:yes stop_codon:yes gene_type:complete